MKLPFADGWSPKLPPLTSAEARILEALSDTIFPAGAGLPISGRQAHVVAYFEEMLSHLALREQILLRSLMLAFQFQSLATQPRALALFTQLTEEQREKSLRAWDESPYYGARIIFQALRGVLLMAYVDNPEVGQAMGMSPGDDIIRAENQQAAAEKAAAEEEAARPAKGKA